MNWIGDYFASITTTSEPHLVPGRVIYSPIPYVMRELFYLRCDNPSVNVRGTYWSVHRSQAGAFTRSGTELFAHVPDHELNTEKSEELIVCKAKRRPAIVISYACPDPYTLAGKPEKDKNILIAPIYSFVGKEIYSPKFIKRVAAYEFPSLFYLPPNMNYDIQEGFVRLDRLQVVDTSWVNIKDSRLTDDALEILWTWIKYFMTGQLEDWMDEYRTDALRKLATKG